MVHELEATADQGEPVMQIAVLNMTGGVSTAPSGPSRSPMARRWSTRPMIVSSAPSTICATSRCPSISAAHDS